MSVLIDLQAKVNGDDGSQAGPPRPPLQHTTPVCIVGAGIIGMTCALLLHEQGISVRIYERQTTIYPLPRAATMDDEGEHILNQANMGRDTPFLIGNEGQPKRFLWKGWDGQLLTYLDMASRGDCGNRNTSTFAQPALESALALRCENLGVPIFRNWDLHAVEDGQGEHRYKVHFKQFKTGAKPYQTDLEVHTSWVVSAEGANTKLKGMCGFKERDYGFTYDWLIIDLLPSEPDPRPDWEQRCNPERPTTMVGGGPRRLRWELMRRPGEDLHELTDPDNVWRILKEYGYDSTNSEVERSVVYKFQALNCESYWDGKGAFLIGDAAHRMPPFIGQGANSGFRDAAGLAWRLGAILNGQARAETLLPSFNVERPDHVDFIIRSSIRLGHPICQTNIEEAKIQHGEMRKAFLARGEKPEEPFRPRLPSGGLYDAKSCGGRLALKRGNLRAVTRPGMHWELLVLDEAGVDANTKQALERVAGVVIRPEDEYRQEYEQWSKAQYPDGKAVAALVRPDNYVWGFATSSEEVVRLIGDAAAALA